MTKTKAFHLYGGANTRRRQTHALLLSILFGLLAAAAVAGFLYWMYHGNRFKM